MNLGLWPEAVPFDPDDGAGSQELDAYLARADIPPAALIVAGRGMRASEWAPRAAIGLARALVAAGKEVLLADLEFEHPSLHNVLSESATEGLADVLLFGSSLERVTVLPAGQLFEFVSTGGYAPDPVALLQDPGWSRILSELAARNTVFLGFANYDARGLDSFTERVPDVILLAAPDEMSRTAAFLPEATRIAATIRPARAEPLGADEETAATPVPDVEGADAVEAEAAPRTMSPGDAGPTAVADPSVDVAPAEPPAEAGAATGPEPVGAAGAGAPGRTTEAVPPVAPRLPEAEFERIRLPKDEAREALIADLRARQRSAMARAAVATPEPAEADSGGLEGEPVESEPKAAIAELRREAGSRQRPAPPTRRGRYAAIALLVFIAAAAIWYFGFRGRGGAGNAPTLAPTVAEPPVPPDPAGEPLGWSVAVEAQASLSLALRSVDSLAARDSTIGFYVSPAVVSGDLWYRVLAGPLADSLGAVAAMDSLVVRGLKKAFGVWDVRNTPLTFLLGRFRRRTDAVDRMHELTSDGVPTYIVEVPYSRGEPWYHLYSGAYADAPEAARMRQILRDAGLPDSLVVRTGRAAS